jgi:hypothetical protein
LPITDGVHVQLADRPEDFARALVHLLRHPAERRRLEAAARALVTQHYDWSAVAGQLERVLVRVAGSASDGSFSAQAWRAASAGPIRFEPEPTGSFEGYTS